MGQGQRPSTGNPEIYDICFWKRARYGWSGDRIAEYLLKEHGVENERHPGKPVHRATVLKWAALGEENLTEEQAHKHKVEMAVAYVELDDLKEKLHDFIEQEGIAGLDETAKFIETALKIRAARNQTWALAEKVNDLLAKNGSGIELDPETDAMLKQLEEQNAQNGHRTRYPLYVDNRDRKS